MSQFLRQLELTPDGVSGVARSFHVSITMDTHFHSYFEA